MPRKEPVRPLEERERRAELQRQRRAARREGGESPPSTPSTTSRASTPSLPPAPPPSESAGSLDRLTALLEALAAREKEAQTTGTKETTPPKSEAPKKRLPSDPAKRDAALDSTRWMAAAPVDMLAAVTDALDARPMSERERANLIEAWAAFIWFYGWEDPRIMLLLAHAGFVAPRAVDGVRNWQRKRKGEKPHKPWKDAPQAGQEAKPAS